MSQSNVDCRTWNLKKKKVQRKMEREENQKAKKRKVKKKYRFIQTDKEKISLVSQVQPVSIQEMNY